LLAADIRRHLAHKPIRARPDSVSYSALKFVRRHRISVLLAAGVVTAFIAGTSMATLPPREYFRGMLAGGSPAPAGAGNALTPGRRAEILIELGDSYAQDHDWRNALTALEQARSELQTLHAPEADAMRAKVEAGIKQARSRQELDRKGER